TNSSGSGSFSFSFTSTGASTLIGASPSLLKPLPSPPSGVATLTSVIVAKSFTSGATSASGTATGVPARAATPPEPPACNCGGTIGGGGGGGASSVAGGAILLSLIFAIGADLPAESPLKLKPKMYNPIRARWKPTEIPSAQARLRLYTAFSSVAPKRSAS